MGSTELSSLQRYRENTQKKKNSLFTKILLDRAPVGPSLSQVSKRFKGVLSILLILRTLYMQCQNLGWEGAGVIKIELGLGGGKFWVSFFKHSHSFRGHPEMTSSKKTRF